MDQSGLSEASRKSEEIRQVFRNYQRGQGAKSSVQGRKQWERTKSGEGKAY